MRITRKIPETGPILVEVNEESKMFKWFEVGLSELGELQYQARSKWVDADGNVYRDPSAALVAFDKKRNLGDQLKAAVTTVKERATLAPDGTMALPLRAGSYIADMQSVTQKKDRLIIETRDGEITIFFGATPSK